MRIECPTEEIGGRLERHQSLRVGGLDMKDGTCLTELADDQRIVLAYIVRPRDQARSCGRAFEVDVLLDRDG